MEVLRTGLQINFKDYLNNLSYRTVGNLDREVSAKTLKTHRVHICNVLRVIYGLKTLKVVGNVAGQPNCVVVCSGIN